MRQRNESGSPLSIPDIPALVLPGDEIDFPEPLAGFTVIPDPEPAKATRKTADKEAQS